MLHKKPWLTSFRVLCLAFIYTISLCILFVTCKFYFNEHLLHQAYPGSKNSPVRNPKSLERNENRQREYVLRETPPPPSPPVLPRPPPQPDFINITSHPYIINEPNKCKDESPFLIFLVETTAGEVENRRAIRATFGNKTTMQKRASIMCLFLLGQNDNQDPKAILMESNQYHDIIQKDFRDTYRNLTFKTMMGIEWVVNYCPAAKYVMKTDSDMFVNTDRLLDLLGPDQPQKQNYFTGFVMESHRPHRNVDSKWHMPASLYPREFYPTICSGTGYVFSGDLAPKILRSSFKVKYVYLEDVFVGLCLEREGVKITNPPDANLFHNGRVDFVGCAYNRIITSHYMTPEDLLNYWLMVQSNKELCSSQR